MSNVNLEGLSPELQAEFERLRKVETVASERGLSNLDSLETAMVGDIPVTARLSRNLKVVQVAFGKPTTRPGASSIQANPSIPLRRETIMTIVENPTEFVAFLESYLEAHGDKLPVRE